MWTCKPQNGVPGGGDMSGGKLDRFLCLPGSRGRDDPAEKGRTIATPPFLPLYRHAWGGHVTGHVTWPVPPLWGSLSSYLSLREGFGQDPEHKPQAGADAPKENPIKWRYPVLISGGFCCSAWGFIYRPFPMPGEEPALDLMLYHTPNFYAWIIRWYYMAPAAAVIVGGLFIISVWRVWFENVGG